MIYPSDYAPSQTALTRTTSRYPLTLAMMSREVAILRLEPCLRLDEAKSDMVRDVSRIFSPSRSRDTVSIKCRTSLRGRGQEHGSAVI